MILDHIDMVGQFLLKFLFKTASLFRILYLCLTNKLAHKCFAIQFGAIIHSEINFIYIL